MKNNKARDISNLSVPSGPALENSMGDYQSSWITDYAWISGVAGAVSVILLAIYYRVYDVLAKGLHLFGTRVTDNQNDSLIAALFIISLIMVMVEAIRIGLREKHDFFVLHPLLKSGRIFGFIFECVIQHLACLGMLCCVIWFYHYAGEYGFQNGAHYYALWFRFIDVLWYGCLYAGLPYILLTRALKYDIKSDERDYGNYFLRLLSYPIKKIIASHSDKSTLGEMDKKITRGLLVKLFFAPLMTVFFLNQFPHLINNVSYLSGGLWESIAGGYYSNSDLNNDLYNISISFIFSIDVALAWCGYLISTRWVDNQTRSAEPTVLGWLVCLICYPPFQRELGLYFSPPGETEAIYMFQEQWVITIFLVLMISSYLVYMSATVWFGPRFSNLTHRGIIRTGPFAIIRHPAYASKNFAWWCIMFPAIVYSAFNHNFMPAVLQTLGLILMTWVYYWRALSEERHLAADPAYIEYCQHVRYRFIPGVL